MSVQDLLEKNNNRTDSVRNDLKSANCEADAGAIVAQSPALRFMDYIPGLSRLYGLQWKRVRTALEVTDLAFIYLRIVLLLGGIGWLVFSPVSHETFRNVNNVFFYFAAYSVFIYLWLLHNTVRKRTIYVFALFFDLIFASLLVTTTGGVESSFFNGFYLITALYSFYFGLVPGILIAVISATLYFISCSFQLNDLLWTDFSIRVSFLFLMAIPLGILSQKLNNDKKRIEALNRGLKVYIDELNTAQDKLIQAEKLSALGRLTADIAHEIRNPLTSIGGFARRLDRKLHEGTKEKEYSGVLVSEVNRLERILKDVLSFSRESRIDLRLQSINNPVSESLQAFMEICLDQQIRVEQDLSSTLPEVLIDKNQIRQAVNNLISNAIDAMPGGGTLTVRTSMRIMNAVDYIVIEVADTGRGLPKESLDMIFEPFYTTKEIGVGTGLGLAICKKIVDEHNGLIFARRLEERGAYFEMLFPYQSRGGINKMNCWEFHKCGVENAEGAANMRCPAYPDYGRICWAIAGTFCGKKVSGAIAQKLGNCKKCDFYKNVAVQKNL